MWSAAPASVPSKTRSASSCSAEAQPLSHVFTEDSCCPGIGPLVSSQQSFLEFSNGILMPSCACSILRSIFFRLFLADWRNVSSYFNSQGASSPALGTEPSSKKESVSYGEVGPVKSRRCGRAATGLFLGTCLRHDVNRHCHLVLQAHEQIPSSCLE